MDSKFSQWSPENAIKAYLKTLKMGIKTANKEPNTSEFIAAIAAGNNAKLMVVTCGLTTNPSTILALLAAANQTGGQVTCIFNSHNELQSTKQALIGLISDMQQQDVIINYVIGDAHRLILEYKGIDFVVIDCKLQEYDEILRGIMQSSGKCKGAIVLGINAFSTRSSWQCDGLRTQLLPIGDGLLLTRIGSDCCIDHKSISCVRKKSHWVSRVDKYTGEEHVFRVT